MATKKKAAPEPTATPGPPAVAIGDHVRLPAGVENECINYRQETRAEVRVNPTQGIVLSIRDIKSGQLVAVAAGDTSQYLFELLQDRTFLPGFSSDHNAGKGVTRVGENPAWARLRGALRQKTGRGELANQATTLTHQPPVASVLDGWRMVKVRARALESLEPTAEEPAR